MIKTRTQILLLASQQVGQGRLSIDALDDLLLAHQHQVTQFNLINVEKNHR